MAYLTIDTGVFLNILLVLAFLREIIFALVTSEIYLLKILCISLQQWTVISFS